MTKDVTMDDTACMGDVEMGNVELHNRDQWQAFAAVGILYTCNMHTIVSLVKSFNLSQTAENFLLFSDYQLFKKLVDVSIHD